MPNWKAQKVRINFLIISVHFYQEYRDVKNIDRPWTEPHSQALLMSHEHTEHADIHIIH